MSYVLSYHMNCNFIYRIKQAFTCCCKQEDAELIGAIGKNVGLDISDAEANNMLALHFFCLSAVE
jgi:hypothetical protein